MKAKALKGFDALADAFRNRALLAPTHAAAKYPPHPDTAIALSRFADEVGQVTRLANPSCAETLRPKPKPRLRPGEAQVCTVARPVSSAQARVPNRSANPDCDSWHAIDVDPNVITELSQGKPRIEDRIDLHGRTRHQAHSDLKGFVQSAVRSGKRCVLLVHGKGHNSPNGKSVLKSSVPGWLKKRDDVMAFTRAPECRGGDGALIVRLRRKT